MRQQQKEDNLHISIPHEDQNVLANVSLQSEQTST